MFNALKHLHPHQPAQLSSLAGTNPSVSPRESGQLSDSVLVLLCVTSEGLFDITIGFCLTLGTPLNSFSKTNQRENVWWWRRRRCAAVSAVI